MPAVARVSESPIAAYIFYWEGEPQGIEGRQVREATRAVQRHLREPASSLLGDDDISYRSVPFRAAFTVRVKYQLGEKLQPMAYPDEE
jgi:hypothetical protein